MGQDVSAVPSININGELLEVSDRFTNPSSTIMNNLSHDAEIDKRIGSYSHVEAEKESVGKPPADLEHKTQGV